MTEHEKVILEQIRTTAETLNVMLIGLVNIAALIIPHDLASDFIYEVIDLERVGLEVEKER